MSSLQVWFKIQVGNTTRHISTENLFNTPGKKGVEKRALDKLIHEDLGVTVIKTRIWDERSVVINLTDLTIYSV